MRKYHKKMVKKRELARKKEEEKKKKMVKSKIFTGLTNSVKAEASKLAANQNSQA